jgi:hypothetical protein
MVGYGLDITDMDKTRLKDWEGVLESKTAYREFLTEATSSAVSRDDPTNKFLCDRADENGSLYDLIGYDDEFGFPDKLMLIPLGMKKSWHRYNDDLDYAFLETEEHYKNMLDIYWAEKLGNIYPFTGLMRKATEEDIAEGHVDTLGIHRYQLPMYLERDDWRDLTPAAPTHLWYVIKHLGLVQSGKDEDITDVYLSLRPSVARWYS